MTAAEAARRVIECVGVPTRPTTVDTFLAGDPETMVTGVVVTVMATVDVCRAAVAAGANLIITHEPLFYDHANAAVDDLEAENDPIYLAKKKYIEQHGLVVWHLHDHWHDVRPDGIDLGVIDALGWVAPDDLTYPAVLTIEPMRLGELAAHAADRLGAGAARFIGDPGMRVTVVALALGFRGTETLRGLFQRDDIDAVLIGEAHEWELSGYIADAAALAAPVGVVVLGHLPSEQAGMSYATGLIEAALAPTPVEFIAVPDIYRPVSAPVTSWP
jgi:putative NIF3 family GTP cyclohydrolase 1 type 2